MSRDVIVNIYVSDDESSDEVPKESTTRKRKRNNLRYQTDSVEIIVKDEESLLAKHNIHKEIDLQYQKRKKQLGILLNKISEEDKLFSEYAEKCLDLENSDKMIHILKMSLIPHYKTCDKKYIKGARFRTALIQSLRNLDLNPQRKFSNIKDLVETLRINKKRVQLTTLSTNIKDCNANEQNFPRESNSIIVDSDEENEIFTINLDDSTDEVIDLDDSENEVNEIGTSQSSQEGFLVPHIEMQGEPSSSHLKVLSSEDSVTEEQVLPIHDNASKVHASKIKLIESQIAYYKDKITQLEEAEVKDDSVQSPYILSEKYKAHVVQMYKELCTLTGEQPVKQRKVRLQVLEGHPPGPVKRLEAFINENIGENGIPLFPDYCDVVKCVIIANIEDKLSWSQQQVLNEATALFTQCGRALQKRRQRREYRDLLSKLKEEAPDFDPANEDPELYCKLEKNKKIAIKKEKELLERFAKLEDAPLQKLKTLKPVQNKQKIPPSIDNGNLNACYSRCSDTSDEDSNFEPPEVRMSQDNTNKTDCKDETVKAKINEIEIKQEPMDVIQLLEEMGDNYTTNVFNIEDPTLIIEISSDDDTSDEEIRVDGESES